MKLTIETGRENPILRARSEDISQSEWKKLAPLGRAMLDWLKSKDNGAGLAAPQVGINKRLIAVNMYDDSGDELMLIRTFLMINPVVLSHSEVMEKDEEGCFSVPDEYGLVSRYDWIVVEFMDENYKKKTLKLFRFNARVVLHEIDHLDGILFTDKISHHANL